MSDTPDEKTPAQPIGDDLIMPYADGVLAPDQRPAVRTALARDPELMQTLSESGIVLEICPTSNLLTKALPDEEAIRETFRAFVENGVAFTIATDGPEMMRTHLRDELELLLRIDALTEEELHAANARGHAATFIGTRVMPVR